MKNGQFRMSFRKYIALFFLGFNFWVFGQKTETEKLLEQAQEIVHQDPVEANHISEYNLKLSVKEGERIKSLYVQALSYYIMGQYSKSLETAFKGKRMAIDGGNKAFETKNLQLIDRTLQALNLKAPKEMSGNPSGQIESFFQAEDYYQEAHFFMNKNQQDSARIYAKQAEEVFATKNQNWLGIYNLSLKGDAFFKEMKMDSSVVNYKKALKIAHKINNPFFQLEIHQKLANSYLAMDSISNFQTHTQRAEQLTNETVKLENEASNSAHMLISSDLDLQHAQMKSRYQTIFWVILSLLGLGILIKTLFYFRNENKLKMYRNFLDYMHRKENVQLQIQESEEEEEEEKKENPKSVTLLKESENQILSGLEKFESGKKFTNKDMSLGMLAAQLNTNTKYLSEVINRQKEKNFNAYINELRINYITEKMKSDPNYLNFKVSYLAEECGFSSHSTFTTVFKSIVGVSPIMFVEFIREEMNSEKLETVLHDE